VFDWVDGGWILLLLLLWPLCMQLEGSSRHHSKTLCIFAIWLAMGATLPDPVPLYLLTCSALL
jgi:hypothetical protein